MTTYLSEAHRNDAREESRGRIAVVGLTKRYGSFEAVSDLSFTVEPGRVTGFIGPNGAGKTTTLRMLLGLTAPTAGTATVGGSAYTSLPEPLRAVGAVLEASSAHRGRTGRNHLRAICLSAGIDWARADEVLADVGLEPAADRPFRGYSLGMRQRLGIASALLGDPDVLILDEPTNGLDPEGIRWMRGFLRALAGRGRTVLVSSHLLTEMQSLADDVVIVAAGRLVRQGSIEEVLRSIAGPAQLDVRCGNPDRLQRSLSGLGGDVVRSADGTLHVSGMEEQAVGDAALAIGVAVHHLASRQPDLEEAFLALTHDKAGIR